MLIRRNNKKFVLKIVSLGIFLFLGAVFLSWQGAVTMAADANDLAWNGQQAQFGEQTGLSDTNPVIVVTRIIQFFLGFLGFIALILIIYAGFLWMTSAGDADKIKKAKDTLKSAFIGLVLILASVGIVTFILNLLINGGAGGGNGAGGGPGNVPPGTGSIGNCAIVDYYPSANQRDIPRNSLVMVTFREALDVNTVADGDGDVLSSNVRLFSKCNDTCQTNTGNDCDPGCFVDAIATTTADRKTLIIMPKAYLGSPTEKTNYYMVLNNNIEASDGKKIFANCTPQYANWSFEVSTLLDLDPPQVLKQDNGGVFPLPDTQKDATSTSAAAKAHGLIKINDSSAKVWVKSKIDNVDSNGGPWSNINETTSSINETCLASSMKIGVNADLTSSLQVGTANAGVGVMSADKKTLKFSYCDLSVALESGASFFDQCGVSGCDWNMDIILYREPDYLSIDGLQYVFVESGTGAREIPIGSSPDVSSIATAIASKAYAAISMAAASNIITITAKEAGKTGSDMEIISSNAGIVVTPMSGGVDLNEAINVDGKRDEPRNAIIKINFDDQMLPINLSGEATIDSSIFVQCDVAANCTDPNYFFDCEGKKCVKGKFKVSNQYKTAEFQSNNECGMNSCGEKIYCLPANTKLRVGLKAANLATCANDSDCISKNPFNKCLSGHCHNVTTGKNYPLSTIAFDGLMDKARNSLDGRRDENAIGPPKYYNENDGSGDGDNFEWFFYITDKIDLNPPKIVTNLPTGNNVSLLDSVDISFNKIMMSSSLIPGWSMIPDLADSANEIRHKTLNIWAKSGFPIGYWVTNVDNYDSMQVGRTTASINHSDFDEYNNYRAQSGSGIKDIYQNCFKPSDKVAPSCATMANPSCCNGVPTNVLNDKGNCN